MIAVEIFHLWFELIHTGVGKMALKLNSKIDDLWCTIESILLWYEMNGFESVSDAESHFRKPCQLKRTLTLKLMEQSNNWCSKLDQKANLGFSLLFGHFWVQKWN
jgi:hypothetical protein